jgi:hypothetical protein
VAWAIDGVDSYIEFMESGFTADIRHVRRLILHEKSHFMWSNVFDDSLRSDWIELCGWYEDPSDPDGWSTTQQLSFVTAYAHQKNPNEHMAESISYYVENPAALQACCLDQFNFIRDRVMHGYRYVPQLPPGFTFEVFNLAPDYTYPGKIVGVEIDVIGDPLEDKQVTVQIELHTTGNVFDGARTAFFRLFSEIGTYTDVYLNAGCDQSEPQCGTILTGSFSISKYAKAGLWQPYQITLADWAGNQRFAGTNDFGWKLLIDNPLEDVGPPTYVPGSLTISVHGDEVDGRAVQILTTSYLVIEDRMMKQWGGVYARVTSSARTNSLQEYGYPGLTPANEGQCGEIPAGWLCQHATISFTMTEYRLPGSYWVSQIVMKDVAENMMTTRFTDDPADQPRVPIDLDFANPDSDPPELRLSDITITAEPTNPDAPNGETQVQIVYHARDDKSGLGVVNYRLIDPQGGSHFEYHYHGNFYTAFFDGDPTVFVAYTISVVLPVGSAPGIWGLESMELSDKVDNKASHNFIELMSFDVSEDSGGRRRRMAAGGPKSSRFEFAVVGPARG